MSIVNTRTTALTLPSQYYFISGAIHFPYNRASNRYRLIIEAMAYSFLPSSLFTTSTLYNDIDDHTAISQSLTAAVMSLSEYEEHGMIRGGKKESRAVNRGACSWFRDYLSTYPVYPSHGFREVFRIPIPLYWLLNDELVE